MKALPNQRKQKGAVLILVTVALFVLFGFTALALDGGYLILNKTRVQDAVDSAALSGAKTLSLPDYNTHADAIDAVEATLAQILGGEGFEQVDIDVEALSETVEVEFSLEPVPFTPSENEDARYIRVSLSSVPVRQFFSQLLVDVWQVRASAVAGASATIKDPCQIIPLMMCVNDENPPSPDAIPEDYNYGFNPSDETSRGDVVMIKSPSNSTPVGPGNFLAVDLDGANGAAGYGDGLAGALNDASCISPGESITTKTGNMSGPTEHNFNTRFGDYSGEMGKYEPSSPYDGSDAYYADCSVPQLDPNVVELTEDDFVTTGGSTILPPTSDKYSQLQSYEDYINDPSTSKMPTTAYCLPKRRMVKVPIGDCSNPIDKGNGKHEVASLGTMCMYLSQRVTDGPGNEKYIVAEFVKNCTAEGSGYTNLENGPDRLVLYKNSGSGDS
ncbi:pilus assembly protein TadG-related protein [Oceanimonas baumannii]|uniref:pilus assembly protein TadG-related protein n=1 Tax=Oceanimonas baumannii TaxID=129578 RepID=UPI003A9238B0